MIATDTAWWIYSLIISPFAIFENCVLLHLIKHNTPDVMKPYKSILYYACANDIFTSCVRFSIRYYGQATPHYYVQRVDTAFFEFAPVRLNHLASILHICAMHSTTNSITVQCIVRYMIVRNWMTPSFGVIGVIVGVVNLPICLYVLPLIRELFFGPDAYVDVLREVASLNLTRFLDVNVVGYDIDSIRTYLVVLPTVFCYVMVVGTSYGVYRKLRSLQNLSSQVNKAIQRQLSIVFFCEALVPLLSFVLPQLVYYLTMQNAQSGGYRSVWMAWMLPTAPAIDPIMKILIIQNYRKKLLKYFVNFSNRTFVVSYIHTTA